MHIVTDGITRADYLAWCKKRALEYVDLGDPQQAFASMTSDLNKHPATANHSATTLGMQMLMSGYLDSAAKMRRYIEGYN